MADVQTFILRPGVGRILTFDCLESENPDFDNDITEHPIERGANITDHKRSVSDKLSITVWVSNTPLSSAQTTRAVESVGVVFQTTALTDAPAGQVGYAENALSILKELRDSGELVVVVTPRRVYSDMMLKRLSPPFDAETGDAAKFILEFKQVRFAELQRKLIARQSSKAATPGGKGKVDIGKQAAKPAGPERAKSVLSSIDGFTNGAVFDHLNNVIDSTAGQIIRP